MQHLNLANVTLTVWLAGAILTYLACLSADWAVRKYGLSGLGIQNWAIVALSLAWPLLLVAVIGLAIGAVSALMVLGVVLTVATLEAARTGRLTPRPRARLDARVANPS